MSASALPQSTLQDEASGGTQDETRPRIQFSELDTYYMPDKEGRLIPVFQIPFEEFERLLQQDRAGRPQQSLLTSGFRLLESQFDGLVTADETEVGLRLRLKLLVNESGWQAIPLGLNDWVLDGRVSGPADVSHYLTRSVNGGFVLHVNGPPDKDLNFELTLRTRVERLGNSRRLGLGFPYPTQMQFRLRIPKVGLNVRGGDLIELTTREVNGGTEVSLRELTEKSALSWQESAADLPAYQLQARVESALRIQSLGVGRWQVTSTFDLTPLADRVAELIVALPTTATEVTSAQGNSRVVRVSREEAATLASDVPDGLQYLRWIFVNPLTEKGQLQLSYVVTAEPEAGSGEAELVLQGPQLLDCSFTSGSLSLVKDRELSSRWQTEAGISLSGIASESRDVIAFQLERQDFRMSLANRPQPSQVRVESEYTLITNQRILMTVNFRCQIQGKFAEPLWIELEDWQFVSGGNGVQWRDGRLVIDPSSQSLGSGGELLFHCVLEADLGAEVNLKLPKLQGDADLVRQPAGVILVIDDPSREFRFSADDSTLVRDPAFPDQYRSRDGEGEWRLRGEFGVRPRRVRLSQWTEVLLPRVFRSSGVAAAETVAEPRSVRSSSAAIGTAETTSSELPSSRSTGAESLDTVVHHRVQMEVANQPLDGLSFLLDASVPIRQLQVTLGNELLSVRSTIVNLGGREYYAVEFPTNVERLRGKLDFTVSHLMTAPFSSTQSPSEWSAPIPLAQIITQPISRLVSLTAEEDLLAGLREQTAGFMLEAREVRIANREPWSFRVGTDKWGDLRLLAETSEETRWIPAGPWPSRVVLAAKRAPMEVASTTVRDITVRYWWADGKRREKFIANLETHDSALMVSVPENTTIERVVIDQKMVEFNLDQVAGSLTFAVPRRELMLNDSTNAVSSNAWESQTERQRVQVEIWYSRVQSGDWWSMAEWQLPRLPNQEWCSEFRWDFRAGGGWIPVWASSEWIPLNTELGPDASLVAETGSAPSDGPNRGQVYRYLSGQPPSGMGLLLVNARGLRMFGIAAIALLGILLWRYRWERLLVFWLSLIGLGSLLAIQWPELGLELGPWLALTLGLTLAVVWWDRWIQQTPVVSSGGLEVEEHTTRTYFRDASSVNDRSVTRSSQRLAETSGESTP